jgi:hypothetical protein
MTNQLSRRGFLGRTLLATSAVALGPTLPRLASAQSATGAGWQIGCYTRPGTNSTIEWPSTRSPRPAISMPD